MNVHPKRPLRLRAALVALLGSCLLTACSSLYYETMEAFGVEKRDILVDRVADQVLYLKHSLNAQAIAQLQDNVFAIETDVAALVADMEASIAEADAFIAMLG